MPRARAAAIASNMTAAGSPPCCAIDRDAVARTPDFELFARCRAKGVAGGKQHRIALPLEVLGKLADGSRLAGAVDAGDHHHEGPLGADDQAVARAGAGARSDTALSSASIGIAIGALGAVRELVEQMRRRGNADIGFEERRFELFECFVR